MAISHLQLVDITGICFRGLSVLEYFEALSVEGNPLSVNRQLVVHVHCDYCITFKASALCKALTFQKIRRPMNN